MIIGLTGGKGCGKTTIARVLRDKYGFTILSFATPLKEMLEVMGVPDKYIYDVDHKELPVPGFGKSARFMMQTLGTEWGRGLVSENIWVKALETKLSDIQGDVVLDDVRFPNECALVHSKKGKVVRVNRPGLSDDLHVSETGVFDQDVDGEIDNLSNYYSDLENSVTHYMEIGQYGTIHNTKLKSFPCEQGKAMGT
tara:strand:+ start:8299 stop:8886 length:588 start_codon:yes stop_codon:yes gene_type:complete